MASCVGCKKRTTSFCYVHKASVCDDCTASKCAGTLPASSAVPCSSNDVIGNYFDWLADGDFTPARCTLCNRSIGPEASSLVRLVCKDLFHRECLRESLARSLAGPPALSPAHLKCPSCNLALVDPNTQPRTKLREAVADFVAQVARGGGGSAGGSAASSSTAGAPSTPSRSAASPASSASGGADSRFSPQVRDLMSKAASARAALPAGATLPSDVLSASPASSTSAGLYPSAAVAAVSARGSSPLSSSSPAAAASSSSSSSSAPSPFAASAAAAAQAKADLEAQVEGDDLKGHKPSRLAGLRRALAQRSKLIVMLVVTLALLMLFVAYTRTVRTASAETKMAASILSPEN